jgi:predicted nuclease of predicted toxin-antitoxin system
MRFLLDESAEFRIAAFLREQGHDVTAIAHDYPHALSDAEVLALASSEGRILLTNDRDFGELIFRQHRSHAGIIYFRLGLAATAEAKIAWLGRILVSHGDRLDHFLVVTPRSVRVRQTPSR